MKKIFLASVFILIGVLFLNAVPIHAQTGSMPALSEVEGMGNENAILEIQTEGDMHTESVETVLQDILNQQNVSTVQELDLSKLGDDDWERLGDAVMEAQHPGQAHEVMDQMMGGEGSESLRLMHINMGRAYLGYGNSGSGMMGGGFPMMGGFGSMMGYNNSFVGNNVLVSIALVALIAFLLAGTYFFIKQSHRK